MNPYETYTAYQIIWRAKIRYVIQNVWFTKKECEQLLTIVLQSTLPKLHLNRHFPKEVIYVNIENGGLGLLHTYYEQAALAV